MTMTMSMIMIEVDLLLRCNGQKMMAVVKERGQAKLTCSGVSQCQC